MAHQKSGLFIIAICLSLVACKQVAPQEDTGVAQTVASNSQEKEKSTITLVTSDALQKQMDAGATQLIDVRTDREWERGHLKNAKHFEINNPNWEAQIKTLDTNEPVYVYCAKGGRSARAAKQLKEAGFSKIYDLKGGITDWQSSGKPLE